MFIETKGLFNGLYSHVSNASLSLINLAFTIPTKKALFLMGNTKPGANITTNQAELKGQLGLIHYEMVFLSVHKLSYVYASDFCFKLVRPLVKLGHREQRFYIKRVTFGQSSYPFKIKLQLIHDYVETARYNCRSL